MAAPGHQEIVEISRQQGPKRNIVGWNPRNIVIARAARRVLVKPPSPQHNHIAVPGPSSDILLCQFVVADDPPRLAPARYRPATHKVRLLKLRQFPLPRLEHRPRILAALDLDLGPVLGVSIVPGIARGVEIGIAPRKGRQIRPGVQAQFPSLVRFLQHRRATPPQLIGRLHVGDAEVQAHRLQRLGFFKRRTRPRRRVAVAGAVDHHLRLNRHQTVFVANDDLFDMPFARHHIRNLGVQQDLNASVFHDRICRPLEALRIAARNRPFGVHLHPGQIAVDIEAQMRRLPRLHHPHPLQHLEHQPTDHRRASALVDKAIESRADNGGKETAGKTIALDDHRLDPAPQTSTSGRALTGISRL